MLVWIDCEMTGLDLGKDALIEVAVLVTDGELNIKDKGLDLLISPPPEALKQMSDFVREMHTTSGLLTDLESATLTIAEAEKQILAHIQQYVPGPRKTPLAGNTIGTDRSFLARDMPTLEQWLHYRNVDVSTIKELTKRWYPKTYYNAPNKNGNHRALADIQESIEELRYYREAVFVAEAPSTDQAREIATHHQGVITGFGHQD